MIVIPALNEASTIEAVLSDLGSALPIYVLDGGSDDATREIVRRIAATAPHVRLIDNKGRSQARALNLAARIARRDGFDAMIRADAHARYPQGWARTVLDALNDTGADCVVVPLIAVGGDAWQTASSILQTHWLGHGGAQHRRGGSSGWARHGHHAAFRLDRFLAMGGYDDGFDANEDAEFDLRLTAQGGRSWFCAEAPVHYIPRARPSALFRQMRRNGEWRMRTALKHRQPLQLRQMLPLLAVAGSGIGTGLGLAGLPIAALVPAAYLALVTALSAAACLASGSPRLVLRVACLALSSHHGFAIGLVRGALSGPRWRTSTPAQARPA
ncbi:glycosyltransferase family 2 protein [Anianabacter salinae]|uniref:glycosyltransferase family 2 protein n=1 Tax=Anianabacter salinae TaxID=2851023 RepID=UPI00225E4B44|nr:glycosyltransferase family 2 protein [Anianabacter salinae]MBV0911122.1 glycosyltransferase family 2 protein [Anianabacter salinae]